jgi:hypothetical protein
MMAGYKYSDYNVLRAGHEARSKTVAFNIRNVDSNIMRRLRVYCAERTYPMNMVIEALMAKAVKYKRRLKRTRPEGRDRAGQYNARGIRPAVMRMFRAHCIKFQYPIYNAIEQLIDELVTAGEPIELPRRHKSKFF